MARHMKSEVKFDYEVTGNGPPLIFLHGWPFQKATYYKLIPYLEPHFTCYNLNSLGIANDGAGWRGHGMDFKDHADRVLAFADQMGISQFGMVGHDTGGTIARLAAAKVPSRVTQLVLTNTEIPGHRPPFVPFYQKFLQLPGSWRIMRMMLRSKLFRHSRMAFGNLFYDRTMIDADFGRYSTGHFISTGQRFRGLTEYLKGLNFNVIDTLDSVHKQIKSPILFIWGANDITFETKLGRRMAHAMSGDVTFVEVEKCCFLPHEEQPAKMARIMLEHMNKAVAA